MTYRPVPLEDHLNTIGATWDSDRRRGMLNAWGNSFPAEELPFGTTWTVAGIPFLLPHKRGSESPDLVEPLGQTVPVGSDDPVRAVAFLCCGEMGDQLVPVRAVPAAGGPPLTTLAHARGFTVLPDEDLEGEGHRFTHLHYPGDYDLGLQTGALFAWRWDLEQPLRLSRIELGTNPLFRIAALTLA